MNFTRRSFLTRAVPATVALATSPANVASTLMDPLCEAVKHLPTTLAVFQNARSAMAKSLSRDGLIRIGNEEEIISATEMLTRSVATIGDMIELIARDREHNGSLARCYDAAKALYAERNQENEHFLQEMIATFNSNLARSGTDWSTTHLTFSTRLGENGIKEIYPDKINTFLSACEAPEIRPVLGELARQFKDRQSVFRANIGSLIERAGYDKKGVQLLFEENFRFGKGQVLAGAFFEERDHSASGLLALEDNGVDPLVLSKQSVMQRVADALRFRIKSVAKEQEYLRNRGFHIYLPKSDTICQTFNQIAEQTLPIGQKVRVFEDVLSPSASNGNTKVTQNRPSQVSSLNKNTKPAKVMEETEPAESAHPEPPAAAASETTLSIVRDNDLTAALRVADTHYSLKTGKPPGTFTSKIQENTDAQEEGARFKGRSTL